MTYEQIAKGLTKAQRAALLWLDEEPRIWPNKGGETPLWGLANKRIGNPEKQVAYLAIMAKIVGKSLPTSRNLWGKNLWIITPIGLAVRAILEK